MDTIDERITKLMQGNYDPLRADNLAESLANLEIDQVATIANLLMGCQYALLGAYIDTITANHWRKLAETQAQCDEENEHLAACQRCRGEGCSLCEDKEFIKDEEN